MLLLIIFSIIAIVRVKSGKAWMWYGIGLILSIVSTIGLNAQDGNAFSLNSTKITNWCILGLLAIIFAVVIKILIAKKENDNEKN